MIKRVVIVGAGLGGLAVAIALRKQGIDAQIYEKARALKPVGAGLSLSPNGLTALEAIVPGIVKSLKALGSSLHRVNIRKITGELIVQNQLQFVERYQQPLLLIRWSCLQEVLVSLLEHDVIHLNHRLVDFKKNDSNVEIYFEDHEAAMADLLIGADGIESSVRQNLVGDGAPRYAGRLSWRAVIKYQHHLLPQHEALTMKGTDGRLFRVFDVGAGYIFWSAGALSSDGAVSESAATAKRRVLEMFAGWAPPVEAILEATAPEEIVERPIYDRPPLTRWSSGRVTLLGDAAHAMVPALGQGANTAFEDAWELSQFLIHQPCIDAALASYEKSRIYRTQVIQARSAFLGSRSYEPDAEIFLRDVVEQAKADQSEFESWLYNYMPSASA